MASCTIIKTSPTGGDAATIRTALGLTGDENFKARSGKYFFHVQLNEQTGLNLERNWATLVAAGMWIHVWLPTPGARISDQIDALIAAHTGQTALVAGSTEQIRVQGTAEALAAPVVLENMVIDGRTHKTCTIAVEYAESLSMINVVLFSPNGTVPDAERSPQVACVQTPIYADGVTIFGGRGNGGLISIGKGGIVRNIQAGWDSRMDGEGVGAYPGNPQQFLHTIERASGDKVGNTAAYHANANLRRWQTGTNLIGAIGDTSNIRMVKHTGGSIVRVVWPGWVANQWNALPIGDRTWFLHWDGIPAGTAFNVVGGSMALAYADIQAVDPSGNPVNVPAGPVNWFALILDYFVEGYTVDGGRFYSPTTDRMPGSFVTSYAVRGYAVRNCTGGGAGDRVVGGEFLDGALYELNDCLESAGNEMEPITFFGRDVVCRHNRAPAIWVVPNGCPVLNCHIDAGGATGATLNTNTGATWVGGWSANSSHVSGLTMNGAANTPATCTVPEGSWPGGLIPVTDPD